MSHDGLVAEPILHRLDHRVQDDAQTLWLATTGIRRLQATTATHHSTKSHPGSLTRLCRQCATPQWPAADIAAFLRYDGGILNPPPPAQHP